MSKARKSSLPTGTAAASKLGPAGSFTELARLCKEHENYKKWFGPLSSAGMTRSHKKHKKHEVSAPRIFGLDCEMVLTVGEAEGGNSEYSIARVSLVELVGNDQYQTLIDEYVQVPEGRKVVDRLESVSGITDEHLQAAKYSLTDVIGLLEDIILEKDIIIGHSLSSDFESLKWFHEKLVDTSFFFSIRDAPRFTLGLKDAVEIASGESVHGSGVAHDSVCDAKFALNVAKFLISKEDPFIVLEELPSRFRRQLTIFNFPIVDERLTERLRALALSTGGTIHKNIKTSGRKDGTTTGSVAIEYADEEKAFKAFNAFQVDGDDQPLSGYLDFNGYLKKSILLNLEDGSTLKAELSSYHRPTLKFTETWICHKQFMGKVIGPKGARINYIRKQSGVLLSNEDRDDKKVLFTIRADNADKISVAIKLLMRAAEGDTLGIK